MRKYTEEAIKREIEKKSVKNLKEVEKIARSWLSVEEAIVGGLVHFMLPDFLAKYSNGLSESLIEEDLEVKSEFSQYKFLRRGLRIVDTLGPEKALEIYCEDPVTFRKMLFSKSEHNGFQQT